MKGAFAAVAALAMLSFAAVWAADPSDASETDGDYGIYDLGEYSQRIGSGQVTVEFTIGGGYEGMAKILGKNSSAGVSVTSDAPDWVSYDYEGDYAYTAYSSKTYVFATLTIDFDEASATDGEFEIAVSNYSHSVIVKFDLEAKAPTRIVLDYDGCIDGVTGLPDAQEWTGYGYHGFTISEQTPSCDGMAFLGWSGEASGEVAYSPGDPVYISSSLRLYAVWYAVPVSITSSPPTGGLVGTQIVYSVGTNLSGCALEVDGPSWLAVDGGSLLGSPDSPGDYTVTLTASLSGHGQATQEFTLSVHSVLEFVCGPEAGAMAYEGRAGRTGRRSTPAPVPANPPAAGISVIYAHAHGIAMKQCMDSENLHRRLSRIQGQIAAIDRMVDEDVPCEDILVQINAVKSAVHKVGQIIMEGHIKHCVRDGIEHGDAEKTISEFSKVIEQFS